jgi:biopolymer transport protein ExbD
MRYPRNVKVFRGQIDAAPLAGVFFLLVIFMLLFSLVYTPGIPIQLPSKNAAQPEKIEISHSGEVIFQNKAYDTNALGELRNVLKALPPKTELWVEGEPNRARLAELQKIAKTSDLQLRIAGAGVVPPKSSILATATGPTVVVAVNLAGQYFFENQVIEPAQLKLRLAEAVKKFPQPITLIVLADKAVEYNRIVSLTQLAEQAGIRQALLQVSPGDVETTR